MRISDWISDVCSSDLGQSLQVVDRLAQQYQQGEVESRFIIAQTITLRSGDVDRVSGLAGRLGELVSAGLELSDENQWNDGPTYASTGLNDLKLAMLPQATVTPRSSTHKLAHDFCRLLAPNTCGNQGALPPIQTRVR